jgi:peroxin-11C
MNALNDVCDMLDTYTGRDKVIRTLCYTAKLAAGIYAKSDPEYSNKLGLFSSKMSATRATLRLLDDLPMLQYSIEYGLGRKEPDRVMSVIGILRNAIDHVYYPIEKICWLAEHNLLNVKDPSKWDTLSSLCWVASIYLNLIKTIRGLQVIEKHKKCIDKLENETSANLNRLLAKQRMEMITVFRLTLDLVHAGSTLPKGFFLGGKLESWHVGLIGTVSSFIGLYQYFAAKSLLK